MRVLIQRSLNSNVLVDNKIVGQINHGLVLLVGFTNNDNKKIIDKMIDKIINLRIFNDEFNIMNKSLLDVNGEILSVSQFTLYADTGNGRRPSYINSLHSDDAKSLYDYFNEQLKLNGIKVETGIFQADMIVNINNDGPVTIMLESR